MENQSPKTPAIGKGQVIGAVLLAALIVLCLIAVALFTGSTASLTPLLTQAVVYVQWVMLGIAVVGTLVYTIARFMGRSSNA
jgi:hypothetical protein